MRDVQSYSKRSATGRRSSSIMVLEMKVPHGDDLAALRPLAPVFLSYVLSFVYLGIYWNNHHHMLHATRTVTGAVLWANLHLLFWLSLSVHHGLDGRKPFCDIAGGRLWLRVADGGHRVLDIAAAHHRLPG
jgi:hypothetical protein